jgi:hypothetical protein
VPRQDPGRKSQESLRYHAADRRFATLTNFWSHPADASERLSSNANVRMPETTGCEVSKKH